MKISEAQELAVAAWPFCTAHKMIPYVSPSDSPTICVGYSRTSPCLVIDVLVIPESAFESEETS